MPYFYNSRNGTVAKEAGIAGWLSVVQEHTIGLGWHGPFTSLSSLIAFYNKEVKAGQASGWVPPDANTASGQFGTPADATSNLAKNTATAAIPNVTDFLSRLASRNTWIRVAEGVLGGALIIVAGIAALKNTDVGTAAATAAKVVK